MSNQMPIYSHVVPKSQYRGKNAKNGASKERPTNMARTDFDPLNYNHGGQFHLLNPPLDSKTEKPAEKKDFKRSKEESGRSRRGQGKNDPAEGKVEAYLRQNQVSIRQQQNRHSAVRQAEHRVNLRSLPLNDVVTSGRHDRTPSDRHRGFPERERDRDREYRRERDKDRDILVEFDGTPLSPTSRADRQDPKVRKSTSSHKVTEPAISADKRRFFCREWAFQKIAHCLEQRPVSKTCGALVLGDAGSGKTALCQELSEPGQGPQARQQRALNRRLLARHFLQGNQESSLRPGELVRSLAMQILTQSSRHARSAGGGGSPADRGAVPSTPGRDRRNSDSDRPSRNRFRHLGDDGEDSSKPLLGDSEDQHSDEEEARCVSRRPRTIDRVHERAEYRDAIADNQLPEILPRASSARPATNPFLDSEDQMKEVDFKIYENHENLFLRNLSQRQSKELRDSRLLRQSSEPLTEKRPSVLQKSQSIETETEKQTNSPPKSRIPIASFRYPNRSDVRSSSTDNSPHKTKPSIVDKAEEIQSKSDGNTSQNEFPEYQNVLKPHVPDIDSDKSNKDCDKSNKDSDKSNKDSDKSNKDSDKSNKDSDKSNIDSNKSKKDLENSNRDSDKSNKDSDKSIKDSEMSNRDTDKSNKDSDKSNKDSDKSNKDSDKSNKDSDKSNKDSDKSNKDSDKSNKDSDKSNKDSDKSNKDVDLESLLERRRSQVEDVPPPIPTLPVSPRTTIANAYYEKLLAEPEIQQALLPHNLERDPDECFKRALLFPLLEIDPPKQCLFVLVDAIDEGSLTGPPSKEQRGDPSSATEPSRSVAALLARHQHLFPQWLLLVCTARRHCKQLTRMFTGFRKITLDELHRAHVSADVQRYVLARLDTEPRLRARVSSDTTAAAAAAAALDHLRIKSDGCLLYLEKVLDGVADGFIALREIREIPGTLNGLYLWLAQRLFHGRRFNKVRPLLDVMLAARCGVTEDMLYKCLLTSECTVTRDDFNRRLHLLRRILVMEKSTGYLSIFHHSFASWLLDVKHCTRRYLCCPADGDAAIAMCYTLDAKRLTALEIHNYVLHMTNLEQHLAAQRKTKKNSEFADGDSPLDLHTLILLWVLDSGCDVEMALRRDAEFRRLDQLDSQAVDGKGEKDMDPDSEGKESNPGVTSLMPVLGAAAEWRWPREQRVTVTLLELARADCAGALQVHAYQENPPLSRLDSEDDLEDVVEETVALDSAAHLDPSVVFDLATRGDDEALTALLKRHPGLVESCDATGGTALHSAARAGRSGAAGVLLAAGALPDHADADGWSPLRAAAWAGHTEVVEVLLEYGCQVDCVDSDNRTALRAAAWSGHEAVVSRLLLAGAAPDRADGEGRTPLIAAAYMGHADIVRALLDAGAAIDHADEDGRTALAVASLCAGGAACASILIERGADVSKPDRERATPLLVAAFEGHTEICELLLEAEADIEASDVAGRTALWAAASAGHAPTVRLLLFWGATVDNMDAEGRTVLSTAAAQGNVEVVRQLLDRGLDEHHRDNSGWTPLHYAAFEGHEEVCSALLEAGAQVDEADNDGKGALLLAAQEGHTRLVETLLDRWTAPPDQRAHDGKTALRLAALEGHFDTVRALYERGADVDAIDADRRSTLYVLALDNRLAMARYLISECGASVDSRDAEGRTPLHVSAWQGHTDMVNLLIKVGGADVDGRDRCARTALHAAAWRGRVGVLRALLRHGAKPTAVCTQGATPLGIAAQEGHEECVLWLLQHGADPLQADHCGRTPAKVAWRAGHANICRLLERWTAPSAPPASLTAPAAPLVAPAVPLIAPAAPLNVPELAPLPADKGLVRNELNEFNVTSSHPSGSPENKRRSVHSSNSTKSSSNLTGGSARSHEHGDQPQHNTASRAHLSLSFAQQVARCGRGQRGKERDSVIPEHPHGATESDSNLRSYAAHETDLQLRGYLCERDRRRDERHGTERDNNTSPLYASPPRSPASDVCSPTCDLLGSQPPSLAAQPASSAVTDNHFNRDTHMRIILGRESKPLHDRAESKSKRNGIVTNPAMRLVANVRNGLDNAAANIRRTGVALAASASSNNPAVKSNAFHWRRETPL